MEQERPIVQALESAPKPITKEQALGLALPKVLDAGFAESGFAEWIESRSGVNYLRELNGEPPYSWWEFDRMRGASIEAH